MISRSSSKQASRFDTSRLVTSRPIDFESQGLNRAPRELALIRAVPYFMRVRIAESPKVNLAREGLGVGVDIDGVSRVT